MKLKTNKLDLSHVISAANKPQRPLIIDRFGRRYGWQKSPGKNENSDNVMGGGTY